MKIEIDNANYWLIIIGSILGVIGLIALSWYFFSDAKKFSTKQKRFNILYLLGVLAILYAVFDHITTILTLYGTNISVKAVSKFIIGISTVCCAYMAYRNKGIFTSFIQDSKARQLEIEATKNKIKELDNLLYKYQKIGQ